MTMIYEETFNKCRQLQKVQTQIGSRASTSRANKEQGQREAKMVPQSAHNGVAGGSVSFFLSFELSAVLHRDLPCGNYVPNKMHLKKIILKNPEKMYYYIYIISAFVFCLNVNYFHIM